jgi:hypothetical protein
LTEIPPCKCEQMLWIEELKEKSRLELHTDALAKDEAGRS